MIRGGIRGLVRGGIASGGSRFLIAPDYISSAFTFSRAQAGGALSTAFGGDGATVQEFGADTPRFTGVARRLLIEGQRTNVFANPRLAGSPPFTPAAPTGLTFSYAPQTRNGVPGTVMTISGTATSTRAIDFYNIGLLTAAQAPFGSLVSGSFYFQVDVDSPAITALSAPIIEYNPGYATGTFDNFYATRFSADRRVFSRTLTTPSITKTEFNLATNSIASGTAVNFVAWWGGIQFESGAASSLILPPVGTPGASTRGGDVVTAALSGFASIANGFFVCGTIQFLATGYDTSLIEFNDRTFNNRAFIETTVGGQINLRRFTAAADQVTNIGAVPAVNTVSRFGIWGDNTGLLRASFGGSGVVNGTGAPAPSTYLDARVGSVNGLFQPYATYPRVSTILPYFPPDAEAMARIAALPLT